MEDSPSLSSFEYLGGDYAKDKNNFYYYGSILDDDELEFKYIGGNYIKIKDKIHHDYH